jgi:hypothetical protein
MDQNRDRLTSATTSQKTAKTRQPAASWGIAYTLASCVLGSLAMLFDPDPPAPPPPPGNKLFAN